MRIAILTNAFPPLSRGGAGTIAHAQAAWLVRHGHEVKVWVPQPFPEEENDFHIQSFAPRTSVPFADISKKPAWSRLFFHFEDLAPNLAVVEQVAAWKPDVLLTHNLTGCGWGTPRMIQALGIRWVHVLHDVQMFEPSGQMLYGENYPGLRRIWRDFWAKRRAKVFGCPDLTCSPSRWLLDEYKKLGLLDKCVTRVLPNPIEIPEGICEAELKEKSKVVFLGRVSHDKGADVLVQAWRSCEPRLGTLSLVNDGPLAASIVKLNDPSIQITGFLPHAEAMAQLYSSNLLVMPSLVMENQPTVLLEAIAAGLNVVASDVGGVREMLQGYGTIVPPGDVAALAAAIKSTLDKPINPQLREKILAEHNVDKVMGEMVEKLGGSYGLTDTE